MKLCSWDGNTIPGKRLRMSPKKGPFQEEITLPTTKHNFLGDMLVFQGSSQNLSHLFHQKYLHVGP